MARSLVVEDDPDVALIYQTLLKHHGHDVHVSNDGHHALSVLESVDPDLLVVDIGLPGKVDGWSVLEYVTQQAGHPPCIVVTALAEPEHRQRARELACRAYLSKPVSTGTLLAAVDSAVEGPGGGGRGRDVRGRAPAPGLS